MIAARPNRRACRVLIIVGIGLALPGAGPPTLRDVPVRVLDHGIGMGQFPPAGGSARGADVLRPRLVRRGDAVTITLRDENLVIVSAGRALGSAAAGEPVRVVALSTRRTLDAVVVGSAAVRIAMQ